MTDERYDIEVCTDCAHLIANGELPEDNPDFELLPQWRNSHLALDCPEQGCESFSWSRCDGCGSSLGGDRHTAVGFRLVS